MKQRLSFKSIRRKMLCQGCQDHFKALEDRTIPILEPIGNGESVSLGRDEQQILAEWGAKTAYTMFGYLDREDSAPFEHRAHLRETGQPVDHAFVAFLRFEGAETTFLSTPVLARDPSSPERHSYNAVAAFAQVILKVFCVLEPSPHDVYRLPKDRGIQVWPEWQVPYGWPPPISIADTEIAETCGWIPVTDDPDGPTTVFTYPGVV